MSRRNILYSCLRPKISIYFLHQSSENYGIWNKVAGILEKETEKRYADSIFIGTRTYPCVLLLLFHLPFHLRILWNSPQGSLIFSVYVVWYDLLMAYLARAHWGAMLLCLWILLQHRIRKGLEVNHSFDLFSCNKQQVSFKKNPLSSLEVVMVMMVIVVVMMVVIMMKMMVVW